MSRTSVQGTWSSGSWYQPSRSHWQGPICVSHFYCLAVVWSQTRSLNEIFSEYHYYYSNSGIAFEISFIRLLLKTSSLSGFWCQVSLFLSSMPALATNTCSYNIHMIRVPSLTISNYFTVIIKSKEYVLILLRLPTNQWLYLLQLSESSDNHLRYKLRCFTIKKTQHQDNCCFLLHTATNCLVAFHQWSFCVSSFF